MSACQRCGFANREPARFCSQCGAPIGDDPSRPGDSRRVVTVLFSDIVGSTELGELLDAEVLRTVMSRYFTAMQAVLERHGGRVEKFIGDAIMAVFGLPVLHEDDALRAVRAAIDMREELALLNAELQVEPGVTIAARTGVNTGEVVSGDPGGGQTLVTGDAVNTAARLEQAAAPGEILLGNTTWQLVRDLVAVDRVDAIRAKGKATAVPTVRLRSVATAPGDRQRVAPAPLVGREDELARLGAAFEDAMRVRGPMLVTVLGSAGVGKSRLVAEFTSSTRGRATVLRGRCLSYGAAVTFWPVREVLSAAAGIDEADPAEVGLAMLERLVAGVPEGPVIARRLASAIGLSAEPATRDEVFWAVRRTFESLASEQPLVIVIEDIHWAEPTLLALLEHLAGASHDAPLLVLALARPELHDLAPGWDVDRPNRTTLRLDPLGADASVGLLASLPGGTALPPELRDRILATAEGNPLFLEEMVRMLHEADAAVDGSPRAAVSPSGAPGIPATVQAVIAARVDRLPATARSTLQRASVVGRAFEKRAVEALTPQSARLDVGWSLRDLVRRDLIVPERSESTTDDAFKFRHALVRDAAYAALAKAERAKLHEEVAAWLETTAGGRSTEYPELVGFHLERAYEYRAGLREATAPTLALGRRAAAALIAAGQRARDRGDAAAAVQMLRRADRLPAPDPRARGELLLQLGLAQLDLGDLAGARNQADVALAEAFEVGNRGVAVRARLLGLDVSLADGTILDSDPAAGAVTEAARLDAEASGDPYARALAWQYSANQAYTERRFSDSSNELRIASAFARDAGDRRLQLDIDLNLLAEALVGPTTASEVVVLGSSILAMAAAYPTIEAQVLRLVAVGEAMLGRTDEARAHSDQGLALLTDLAQHSARVEARVDRYWVLRLAGDLAGGESELRSALGESEAIGNPSLHSYVACRLAELLVTRGQLRDAGRLLDEADRNPTPLLGPRRIAIRARLRAAAGDDAAGAEVGRFLGMVSDGHLAQKTDLTIEAAEIMDLLGDRVAARARAEEALQMAEAKENRALAAQVRILLARLAG